MSENKPIETVDGHSTASANLDLYLLLARLLFQNGASASRIIDSVAQLRRYLRDYDVNVSLAYESITITRENGEILETKVGKRRSVAMLNVRVLQGISKLLKAMREDKYSVEEIRTHLKVITENEALNGPWWWAVIAFCIAAVGFGLLNGADNVALLAVIPAALLLAYIRHKFSKLKFHFHAALLLSTLISTLVAAGIVTFLPTNTAMVAIIAILLPLVPGFPLVTGGSDVFCNYNSIGVGRFTFAIMNIWVLTISLVLPLMLFPHDFSNIAVVTYHNVCYGVIRDGIVAGAASLALSIMFKAPKKLWIWFFVGGFIARAVRTYLVLGWHINMPFGAFCGAVAVAFCAYFMSKKERLPASTLAMICVLPMIPGYLMMNGFDNLAVMLNSPTMIPYEFFIHTIQLLLNAIYIVAALITGVIFPLMIVQRRLPKI